MPPWLPRNLILMDGETRIRVQDCIGAPDGEMPIQHGKPYARQRFDDAVTERYLVTDPANAVVPGFEEALDVEQPVREQGGVAGIQSPQKASQEHQVRMQGGSGE